MSCMGGASGCARAHLDAAGRLYPAEVPAETPVYLTPPALGGTPNAPEAKGRPFTRPRLLEAVRPVPADEVAALSDTSVAVVAVREAERGLLADAFAARRIWTVREGQLAPAWLVIRRHLGTKTAAKHKISSALSNAPADIALARLAELKGPRSGMECANREAKSDLGWDDFRAQKYLAWFAGNTTWRSSSWPPGLSPRPSWRGCRGPHPTPPSPRTWAWRACLHSPSPTCAGCSKPACPYPNSRPSRLNAWS